MRLTFGRLENVSATCPAAYDTSSRMFTLDIGAASSAGPGTSANSSVALQNSSSNASMSRPHRIIGFAAPPLYTPPQGAISMELKDKTCLITGGTKGIRAATALLFAQLGAKVAVVG